MNHPFNPVFNQHSAILILGSFPSGKSRAFGFYYGHPQNRFWKIIAHLTQTMPLPVTIDEKKQMLLQHRIALWDIVKRCDIQGSSDMSITSVIPNDLSVIFNHAPIKQVFANGEKSYKLCRKYSIEAIKLPSTSPANAQYGFAKLIYNWRIILNDTLY
jgi:hypoxanthine-DNA glycosylase